jgi:hypothetical protein
VKVLLSDLFSTLVPGGDAERAGLNELMAAALGVDPVRFGREFDAASYERFTGVYGDLENTVRVIAQRAGGDPDENQVLEATGLRRNLTRRLLAAAPATTHSPRWRTCGPSPRFTWRRAPRWACHPPPACTSATVGSTIKSFAELPELLR